MPYHATSSYHTSSNRVAPCQSLYCAVSDISPVSDPVSLEQLPAPLSAGDPSQQQKLVLHTRVDQRVGADGSPGVRGRGGRRAQEGRLVRDELVQQRAALGAHALWGESEP